MTTTWGKAFEEKKSKRPAVVGPEGKVVSSRKEGKNAHLKCRKPFALPNAYSGKINLAQTFSRKITHKEKLIID